MVLLHVSFSLFSVAGFEPVLGAGVPLCTAHCHTLLLLLIPFCWAWIGHCCRAQELLFGVSLPCTASTAAKCIRVLRGVQPLCYVCLYERVAWWGSVSVCLCVYCKSVCLCTASLHSYVGFKAVCRKCIHHALCVCMHDLRQCFRTVISRCAKLEVEVKCKPDERCACWGVFCSRSVPRASWRNSC